MAKTCVKSLWIFQFTVQIPLTEKLFSPYWLFKAVINVLTIFKGNLCLSCGIISFKNKEKGEIKILLIIFLRYHVN